MNASVSDQNQPEDQAALVGAHTRRMSEWATNVTLENIPQQALRRAALVIADDIAVIVGARNEPEVAKFHQSVLRRAGKAEATLFMGGAHQTDRLSAAVSNAVAADWLELDEGYRKISCHAGLYLLPALLAEAEATNLPVRDVLRAVVIAYEVVTRVARAFVPVDDGIHSHANYSPTGACAAVASARRLDAEQYLKALSCAFTMSIAGPRNHMLKGALVRNAWPAVGAWAGMMSVEWAECGISGVAESAYDGFCVALHATPHAERLTQDLGVEWAIMDGYTKIYACCQYAHSAAEAALSLQEQLGSKTLASDIEQIVVETHPLGVKLKEQFPSTSLAAKFSLPHIVSSAFVFGNVDAGSFYHKTLTDPAIAALREKVKVVPYGRTLPPPNDRPSRVIVHLKDGRSLTAECLSAAGGPDRPFGEDVLMNKIDALTKDAYPRFIGQMRKIIAMEPAQLSRGWADVVSGFSR